MDVFDLDEYINALNERGELEKLPYLRIARIIENTEDAEYIKSIIEDDEKIERYKLNRYDIVDLIKATKDPEYIKSIIEDEEKVEKYNLTVNDIVFLIEETNDAEYIKSVIEDKEKREKYEIDRDSFCNLVFNLEDIDYIKSIIEDADKLEEYGLYSTDIIRLIRGVGNNNYTKVILEKKFKNREFDKYDVINLMIDMNDAEYIKSVVEDDNKRKEYGLLTSDIMELVEATKDTKYMKSIIEDDEKVKKYNLTVWDIDDLLDIIDEQSYFNTYLKRFEEDKDFNESDKVVNLPEKMSFGVEIESEGKNSPLIRRTEYSFEPDWEAKGDGSLIDGVEVVSPILHGNNKKDSDSIKNVCRRLERLGQSTSERCGGHIHIGADYLTYAKSWENLLELWGNSEKILYLISNKAGEIPRFGIQKYAAPISNSIEQMISDTSVQLETQEDLKEFAIKSQNKDRTHGINFMNVGSIDKNTIEFRLANGTIDENVWIENINLFGGIIKAAEDITIIQNKEDAKRTDEEKEKLSLFERLKDEKVNEKEKLECLLGIVIQKEERNTYRNRYEVNSKLIGQDLELEEAISKNVTHKSLEIKTIGKKVFTGDDRITKKEYDEIASYIQKEKQKDKDAKEI